MSAFYWHVFNNAWQGPMEEQSCMEWFEIKNKKLYIFKIVFLWIAYNKYVELTHCDWVA